MYKGNAIRFANPSTTTAYFSIYALSSPTPWGPWSQPSEPLFGLDDMPYRYDAIGFSAFYTPAIQPKYSDADGKYVVLWFTYIASSTTNDGQGHQIITAANIVCHPLSPPLRLGLSALSLWTLMMLTMLLCRPLLEARKIRMDSRIDFRPSLSP